jgi:uncharacterized MnhB-related membrane protein
MQNLDLREIMQAVLALMIVAGCGFVIISQPDNPNVTLLSGVVGAVIGFYFTKVPGTDKLPAPSGNGDDDEKR